MFVLSILLLGLHFNSINGTRYSSTFVNGITNVSFGQSPSLPSNEFNALWDFYNSLNGDNWYWSSTNVINSGKRWNFSEPDPNPCSDWYGLTCSCTTVSCHLTRVVLARFGLKGSLPSTIGAWEKLEQFATYANSITGTIPASIGNWTAMEDLNLDYNRLRGNIPISIGNLRNLYYLALDSNLLTGIPPSLPNTPHLKEVYLSNNSFFGPFPQSFANLCCSRTVDLAGNLFSGTIPRFLSSTLLEIYLNDNSFVGSTDSFQNLRLFLLYIYENFLSGDCANDLNTMSHSGALIFAQNLFTGYLPLNSSWTELYDYYGFDNYFTGTISEEFYNTTELAYFSVGGNYLTGTIHKFFLNGQLPRLTSLNMSTNLLTGSLLSDVKSFSRLTQVLVSSNFLTGSVPASFANFTALIDLWLNNNDLTGTVPFSLAVFPTLREFFIQNNYFEGSVSDLLISSSSKNSSCADIDISNNLFTGSLVSSFFLSHNSLKTFATVSNCLEGTIPLEICNLKSLTVLSLDGISTAENCRTLFFPGTTFNGFYLSHSLASKVPSCLFLLPSLESLHLGGNGFSGSIPSSLNISQSLVDLSLSNNELTGPIPENFQTKNWQNLDLSYNKLSGTLSNAFSVIPPTGSLYLEVNRLSGIIPPQLISIQTINILDGNIFSCDSNTDLPVHDPSKQTYSCGSDSVDDFLFLWISCFVIVGSIFCLLYSTKEKFAGSFHREDTEARRQGEKEERSLTIRNTLFDALLRVLNTLDQWRRSFAHYCDRNPSGNISVLRSFFKSFQKGFALIGLLALVFFLPVYSVVTAFNSTYQFEYAWSVSAILLSGELAAVVLFVNFFIIAGLFVWILLYVLYYIDSISRTTDQISIQRQSKILFLYDFISFVASKNCKSGDETKKAELSLKLSWLVYVAVTIVDLVLYGFADISYVSIVVTYNSTVTDFAVVGLALYKFLANHFILSKSIPFMSYLLDHTFMHSVEKPDPNQPFTTRISDYKFTISDISFLEHLMLVNHVVLPIVAVLVILPDCFHNVFYAAAPSNSSYSFQDDVEGIEVGSVNTLTQQTHFTAPFFYSYQCASKVLISFVPLYVMKFCYIGFLRPVKHLIVKLGYDYCYRNYGEGSKLWKGFRLFLPTALQNLQPEVSSRPVYQRVSTTIQLSSYFAIIVVFGMLFPPLAILGSVSVHSMIFVEELLLGRLLYESSRAGYDWYKQRLEEDCEHIRETILVSAQSTLFVSCCFFAFLLIDTWGDKNGWRSALPIAFCILVPGLLFRLYQMSQSIKFKNSNEGCAGNAHQGIRNLSISEDQVEMRSITTENPLLHHTVVPDTGKI
jgi:Leucine-rich repeat (LRR) protein